MRKIGLEPADLPENMWNFTQQIKCLSVGLVQVNLKTMERYDSVAGEAATLLGAATSPWPSTAFLANWTALLARREIFDIEYRRFPTSYSKFWWLEPTLSSDSPEPWRGIWCPTTLACLAELRSADQVCRADSYVANLLLLVTGKSWLCSFCMFGWHPWFNPA